MKPTTTRARLRLYRERAAKSKYNNDWRGHRYARTWEPAWHNWSKDRREIHAEERDTLGDYLGDWSEFLRSRCYDATGFYNDSYCSDTIRGGVVRLRSARFTMYIPCTYCTGWDGATLYMDMAERVDRGSTEDEHESARNEAARWAYGRAEHEAEIAREEDAKFRASEDIEDARAEIHEINKHARALLAEIRGQEFTENVCAALRHRLQEYLSDRRDQFKRIAERRDNFWSAVPY